MGGSALLLERKGRGAVQRGAGAGEETPRGTEGTVSGRPRARVSSLAGWAPVGASCSAGGRGCRGRDLGHQHRLDTQIWSYFLG